eukprot:220213_1
MAAVSTIFCSISSMIFMLANGASIDNLPWSYDTVALWADFGTQNVSLLSEYQSEFIATHYDLVSLEKCLGNYRTTGIPTEESFYKIASSMRKYASPKETKILFYFATDSAICGCYKITDQFCNNQSMQFKDDYGNIISSNAGPFYDHTQTYVREWWTNTMVSVMTTAFARGIIVNGVFADGSQTHFNANVSKQREKEYNEAVLLLFDETRKAFAEVNDDLFLYANGISTYSEAISPGHNLQVFPHVDGMLAEHFGSFEEINSNGQINATDLLFYYNVSQSIEEGVYGVNKSLWIKAWVGPESGPINSFGPSWPPSYNAVTPKTYEELQNASAALVTFPLAVYLCGIYNEYVYFNYAWWYGVNEGYVPCPDDPSSCACPLNWYKEFTNKLGKPTTGAIMTDIFKCNRSFENANVYVDLEDSSSAFIQWV